MCVFGTVAKVSFCIISDIKPRIAVSGTTWMGRGIDSIEKEVTDIFSNARTEIQIMAYSISTRAPELFDLMKLALKNGVTIKLVVNDFDGIKEYTKKKLLKLEASKKFSLFGYVPNKNNNEDALHAKIIVGDRNVAILGSANLSWRGMVSNYEIGVVLHGDVASDVANLVDTLIYKSPQVVPIGAKAG